MPVITNKRTGVQYSVSEKDLNKILANPLTAKSFTFTRVQVPDEVKELIAKKAEPPAKKKRNQKPK